MSQTMNRYERKAGIVADGGAKIIGGEERIDVDKARATGNALESDGVIVDPESVLGRTDLLDHERFMHEELLVQMHDPSHESEPQFVELNVNGDYRLAVRDSQREVKLKRMHVAVLASAKTSSIKQERYTDAEGFVGFRDKQVLRLSYPFTVLHDPSPRQGNAWLRQLITGAH